MLCVTLGALAAMAGEALRGKGPRMPVGWFGIIGLVGAAVSAVILWNPTPEAFREDFGVIVADNFGLFVTLVLAGVGILTIMFSSQVIHRDNLPAGEYYALLLFSIVGMMMMATATDLLVIFVALEILSLAVYVLTGIRRDDQAGTEAAFKYFLLGAISSAFFLYGIAFTYGVTRSTRLSAITQYLSAQSMSGDADGADRARPAAGGLCVQDFRRAVPHVDAGRLRRRAGHRHRVHVHGREGGGVCGVRPRVPLQLRAVQRSVGGRPGLGAGRRGALPRPR